ncbi:hypothetical protein MTR67_025559 [Solanum verrucosum]|uniref:Reverse transcriptase RNase H-like domain-containing protein n=1 Tax=Solanum verrucosum TaxID=315347 RepID=A0AAF0QXD4_SOLVR|nr:hypothetical protein MTR67_025559 [Solanum verrucosum]
MVLLSVVRIVLFGRREVWGRLVAVVVLYVESGWLGRMKTKNGLEIGVARMERNVIAYASIELKVHERNYHTHDLELTAVVFAFKILRHYMYGVKCDIFSNHCSLQHMFTRMDLNLMQRTWMELLKDYGVPLGVALSRNTLGISEKGGVLASVEIKPTFIEEIKANSLMMRNWFRSKVRWCRERPMIPLSMHKRSTSLDHRNCEGTVRDCELHIRKGSFASVMPEI